MNICKPLYSIEELLQWEPSHVGEQIRSLVGLSDYAIARSLEPRPRLLVCHDFKGGYLSYEKQPQGTKGKEARLLIDRREVFTFRHWGYVDIFVYFSHHRVSIPPVCWIEAAHRHGTLVLGTFIFEWKEAMRELSLAIMDANRREKIAQKLVSIAAIHGFEGWLFNIEVHLPSRQYVDPLGELLKKTCELMKEQVGPHALVLWYDSVTVDGRLRWQNRLCEQNYRFFDVCDGIFTNYHWQPSDVMASSALANGRSFDVYTGIDVFGRGTFGGGGYQSYVATQVAKYTGTSVALFAIGWTTEAQESGTDVEYNSFRFWENDKESVGSVFPVRPLWVEFPIHTFFETGCGEKRFEQGQIVDHEPFVNLRKQQLQPSYIREHCHRLVPDSGIKFIVWSVKTDYHWSWHSSCSLLFQWEWKVDDCPQWMVHILSETDLWITKDILQLHYWIYLSRNMSRNIGSFLSIGFQVSSDETKRYGIPAFRDQSSFPISSMFEWIPCEETQEQKSSYDGQDFAWFERRLRMKRTAIEQQLGSSVIKQVVFVGCFLSRPPTKDALTVSQCHLGGLLLQQQDEGM